jgi:hypothetical protein
MFTVTEITPRLEAVTRDPFIDRMGERPASHVTLDRELRTVEDLRIRLGKA